ncbi:TPA: hypothetical protein ACR3Z0_005183 [Bacillus thuringiensis]|uniref:PXO1-51 n=6 Tax=Bacillus cereus group TaxID=86661 RepID=A0A9X6KJ83_BACTU|nr:MULTISPECIES: hypothetical protein [Bacillus cereus group]AEA19476.1 hypothetical protein CT43_P281134 [Bacillus thuringiensis serovar chinensis CT-43]AGG05179.1 pXO1-51 [Bacillus thuringiensis serovar thuringiensis str. IS5056]AHZ54856.1 hypothetical protein YBT1520_31791 [Bacillus thuringiensis serovar kurstaki str. YBT-1520]AIM34589.1 hypothetical protein DF16_pBMB293orf00065 [Bacillus thuringiensis serovar kurstaki str. YBT-1520]AJA23391.1 hypothetical protein BT4G5_31750 [Bacillus thur
MTKKIVLAISDTVYTAYLREDFIGAGFEVADSDVMHIKYLDEILDTEQPNILCINDKRLNIDAGHEEKRELIILQKLRDIRFNRDIRIVVFTERENDDEFLAKLIYLGIYDIFNSRKIDIDNKVIPQLLQESDIKNVAEIVGASQAPQQTKLPEVPVDEEEASSELEGGGDSEPGSNSNKLFKNKQKRKSVSEKMPKAPVIKKQYKLAFEPVYEKQIGIAIPRRTIVVASMNRRSGATFVSHLLAAYLNELQIDVNYIENLYDDGYTYPLLKGYTEAPENYRSEFMLQRYKEMLQKESDILSIPKWKQGKINYIVKNPIVDQELKNETEQDFDHFIKVLLANQEAPISIIDAGNDWDKDLYHEICEMADYIFFVAEPDLHQLLKIVHPLTQKERKLVSYLALEKTRIIGNKFSPTLLKHEVVEECFGDKVLTALPPYEIEDVFESQLNSSTLLSSRNYYKELEGIMKEIAELLLPNQLLNQKKSTILSGFRFRKSES